MIKHRKLNIDIYLILMVLLLAIISLISINSSEKVLGYMKDNYTLKQAIWYIIGFILIIIINKIDNKRILKYTNHLYIFGNITLLLLLIFASPINNAKSWFVINGIGAFQPSEFMKIILILMLSKEITKFKEEYPKPTVLEEFKFIIKIFLIVLIPSILTFLQPDTGVVLIYLLITLIMLFISGIRYRWFILLFTILFLLIGSVLLIYFIDNNLFIKIFGTSFFLRVDRLLDWKNGSGYQLENGMIAIGSAGLFGFGINNTPIYFPEPQTDFIFAIISSNTGFIGSIILIILLFLLDIRLIYIGIKSKNNVNKFIISGSVAMLMYQQIQNIGMTYGIFPITGITLPFISYGGSSLLSYMIILGIILNITKENKKANY